MATYNFTPLFSINAIYNRLFPQRLRDDSASDLGEMLQTELPAHNLNSASSVSHPDRPHCYTHLHFDPNSHRVVARLQPVSNCQIDSNTYFEKTWNATTAQLVSKWKIRTSRDRHRLKRSMVKQLTPFRNSIVNSHLLGPNRAGNLVRLLS